MLNAYGFLTRVFEVFENHRTPVDMITTSEVAVSLTIDDTTFLEPIIRDLSQFAEVEASEGHTIICIVGNALYDQRGHVSDIFQLLSDVPIRMVSMGGSRHNISLLVPTHASQEALVKLNDLFVSETSIALPSMANETNR